MNKLKRRLELSLLRLGEALFMTRLGDRAVHDAAGERAGNQGPVRDYGATGSACASGSNRSMGLSNVSAKTRN